MKKLLMILTVIACMTSVCFGETLQEYFIKSDTGVRQIGMGGAGTAVADDISAVFYNPAGLAKSGISGISFGTIDTNKALVDENHYYAYGLGPFSYFGWTKKIDDSLIYADAFSLARQGGMGLSYGLTYKNIYSEIPGSTAVNRGYSLDAGLILNVSPQFSLGLLGQDAVAEKSLEILGSTRVGMAWRPYQEWLLIAADTEIGREGPGDFTHYGTEITVAEGLKLRAGVDRGKTTFGATLDLRFLAVHYAALLDSDASGGTVHMIGGELSFAEKPSRPRSILRPKEFALVEVGGNLTGGVGDFSIFGGGRVGADSILENIKEANKDPYIDGIMLKVRGFDGGLGSYGLVQEIREELLKSKKKGKKVVAYLEEGTLGDEYYLASAADEIVAPPSATVGGLGKTISVIRIKGLLQKIGIEAQVLYSGKYKTSFSGMSEGFTREQRRMAEVLLADLYRQMVSDVGKARTGLISMESLKEIADGRVFSSSRAKEIGLIDRVGYFEDAKKAAKELYDSKDDIRVVARQDLIKEIDEDYLFAFPNKIAVVDIDGDIVTGKSGQNVLFGGRATGADTVSEQIKMATDDWQVKAIIVRVNSGGGSAVASGQIYSDLRRAKSKGKVIVASMGDVAASGGYYVSAAADKIVADPGTITGSIGVVEADLLVFSGLLKKLDMKVDTVKEGKHADMFSGLRRLTTEEVDSIMVYMNDTYQEFINAVADGRGMATAEVAKLAEGRVYTGNQAKEAKLVDELGNFTDAVDLAAELAKIKGEPRLVYYREQNFFFGMGEGAVKMLGLENGLFGGPKGGLAEYKLTM